MYILWCDSFIVGFHLWMGDDERLDRAKSIELLLEMQKELELDLVKYTSLEIIAVFSGTDMTRGTNDEFGCGELATLRSNI
jgi:hypothetical protein